MRWALMSTCCGMVIDFRVSDGCKQRINECAEAGELTCSVVCSSNPEDNEVREAGQDPQLISEDAIGNEPLGDSSVSDAGTSRRRKLIDVQKMNEQVANAMLNDVSLPGYSQVASVEFTEDLTEPVVVPLETEAPDAEASEKCERVCVDNRIRDCMVNQVCGGEEAWFSEAWAITHYCIAATQTIGGWGFRIPSSVGMIPAQITKIEFNSTLYPSTGPTETFQSDSATLMVAISKDDTARYADSIMHKCAIESIPGKEVQAVISRASRYTNMTLSFAPSDLFPDDLEWIYGDTILLSITGDMAVIANSGVMPPSMYNSTLVVEHYLYV